MTAQPESISIKTLSITFNLPLFPRQLPQFRGAIAELAGWQNELFHNHDNHIGSQTSDLADPNHPITRSYDHPIPLSTKLHYHYPKIQYRISDRQAAIFALQDGVEPLRRFLLEAPTTMRMGGKTVPLYFIHLEEKEHMLCMTDQPLTYKLFKWLPLNAHNYQQWQSCANLAERTQLLERILASNLIAFAKNVGWRLPERLHVAIQHINAMENLKYHGVPLLAFTITYTANIQLPPHIALGKAVSHGFGWQKPVRMRIKQNTRQTPLKKRLQPSLI